MGVGWGMDGGGVLERPSRMVPRRRCSTASSSAMRWRISSSSPGRGHGHRGRCGRSSGMRCSGAEAAGVSSPSLVAPLKNSTLATVPSASAAFAASEIFAGEVKLAPLDGEVSDTVGDWLDGGGGGGAESRLTIVATDGTPAESTMKSM